MSAYQARLVELVERDPRYTYEAYEFVFAALAFTQKMLNRVPRDEEGEPGPKYHVSGPELLQGFARWRCRIWQDGPRLQDVGVNRTDDFGEIIFNLVTENLMSKTEQIAATTSTPSMISTRHWSKNSTRSWTNRSGCDERRHHSLCGRPGGVRRLAGWLLHLAVSTQPIVLAEPQFLVSSLDVIASVPSVKEGTVEVTARVHWPPGERDKLKDKPIKITNLDQCRTTGMAKEIYPAPHGRRQDSFKVAPLPRSPGFAGGASRSGRPRIYPLTPQTRMQLDHIQKPQAPAL